MAGLGTRAGSGQCPTLHCHESIFPELLAACHPPILVSRRNEKKHDQRICFATSTCLKHCFSSHFAEKQVHIPVPWTPTLSAGVQNSLSLGCHSGYLLKVCFSLCSLCRSVSLNLNFTLEIWRQHCKWQCAVQSEICIITFKAELFIVSWSVL